MASSNFFGFRGSKTSRGLVHCNECRQHVCFRSCHWHVFEPWRISARKRFIMVCSFNITLTEPCRVTEWDLIDDASLILHQGHHPDGRVTWCQRKNIYQICTCFLMHLTHFWCFYRITVQSNSNLSLLHTFWFGGRHWRAKGRVVSNNLIVVSSHIWTLLFWRSLNSSLKELTPEIAVTVSSLCTAGVQVTYVLYVQAFFLLPRTC